MHELMACVASMIIVTLLLTQVAAGTRTFIEAAYLERKISEYTSREYAEEEIPEKMMDLKEELEEMQGIRAELKDGRLDVYLEGIIGPADILGLDDNYIHIEKELEFRIKVEKDENSDSDGGNSYDTDAFDQISGGDVDGDPSDDMTEEGNRDSEE